MTTLIIKDSFRSAFSRPVFLILLVITLLMAPASAFASGDDSTADDRSLAADQTEPTDQSGGSEESTSTEQFENPTVYEQDATADSDNIVTDYSAEISASETPSPSSSPSPPDEQSEPAENTGVGNSYTAEITSERVVATGTENTSFTVMFTEVGDKSLGSIQLTLPEGFSAMTLDYSSIQTPEGKNWTGGVVDLVLKLWAEDAGSYLVQGESVSATFTATTPEVPTGYTFATEAWTDNSANAVFDAEGSITNTNNMAAGHSDPLVWVLHQNSPTHISTPEMLDGAVRAGLSGDFIQTANIDLSAYGAGCDGGAGWEPIGTLATPFSGTYDGNGFTISNLFINRPTADYIGLFGYTAGVTAELKNIELVGINLTGKDYVGGLVGYNGNWVGGRISNSYAEGYVKGTNYVGGLVGYNYFLITDSDANGNVNGPKYVGGLVGYNNGTIEKSSANGNVAGVERVGGLVGINYGKIEKSYATGDVDGSYFAVGGLVGENLYSGTIENSHALGTITGKEYTGGLVGFNQGKITNSYAEGDVNGTDNGVGGLAGINWYGTISNSYATGTVIGVLYVGGLVGANSRWFIDTTIKTISNSYAEGAVSGTNYVGGLVGYNQSSIIQNSYASGNVTGSTNFGGLVGYKDSGTISNSYWDTVTSGQATSNGGEGKITDDMQKMVTFENWSISDQGAESTTWRIYEGSTYPLLRNLFSSTATITITAADKTYDGNTSLTNGDYDIEKDKNPDYVRAGTVTYQAASKNVGEDEIILRGVYSNQLEYDLIFVTSPTFKITARDLTLGSFVAGNKTYDGTTNVTGDSFGDDRVSGDLLTFSYNVAFDDKNVGTGKDVDFTSIVISGGSDAGNYNLLTTSGTATADITPKSLMLSNFVAGSKVYDGAADVAGDGFDDDRVAGDALTFSYNVAFADKNVGTDKDVNFTGIAISGGADAGNYNLLTTLGTATADITARNLTLSSFVADDKEYDGTTAVLSGAGFNDDRVAGDALTFNYTVAFEDKNVGMDKNVDFTSIVISGGTDQNNYTLGTNTSGTATADITPKSLTLSNFVAGNKVYDGTTDVTGAGFNDDRIAGDVLTFSYNAAFLDKTVGTGKNVSFTGIVISGGEDAGNYNLLTTSGNAKANITPKSLVITATDITKLYYSTYTFTGTEFTTAGLVSGDDVTFAVITSAGAPKTALPGDYVISIGNAAGTGLSNYDITYVEGKMSVVLPMFDSYDRNFPVTTPAFPGNKALTGITGGGAAHITPAFISSGNQYDLDQAVLAYQEALQRYEEGKELLTDVQRALFETELAVARAAILAMEARLLAAEGLPYNLAALQAAYAAAVASFNAHQSFLSTGQLAAANQLLAAIAGVIAALQ